MLQVRDVTKWFGDLKVLDRINSPSTAVTGSG